MKHSEKLGILVESISIVRDMLLKPTNGGSAIVTKRPKDQSANLRLTWSEITYLVVFIVLLISAAGDAITDHVGVFNILVFIVAPVGIAIIVIRKVGKR